MLSWVIEHILAFIIKQIVLIPYRLGTLCRKGVEYQKAGYKGNRLKIILTITGMVAITAGLICLGILIDHRKSMWITIAAVWAMALTGFFSVEKTYGLEEHQKRYTQIEPWINDFKSWYEADAKEKTTWDNYLVVIALTYGMMAAYWFEKQNKKEKVEKLNSYVDAKTNSVNVYDYLHFLSREINDDLRRNWAQACRPYALSVLKPQ